MRTNTLVKAKAQWREAVEGNEGHGATYISPKILVGKIRNLLHCAPSYTVPQLPLLLQFIFKQNRWIHFEPFLFQSKRGIALDGMLKEGDTNLASSTLNTSDNLGIIISYMIRVKLALGAIGGDVVADVPFKLASPSPEKEREVREMQKKSKKNLTREMSADLVFEDFARRNEDDE